MRTIALAALPCAVALLVAACRGAGGESAAADAGFNVPTAAPVSSAETMEAHEIFAARCTPCHGPSGEGNGPASASLDPKPRNFHDKSWQTSVDDTHIVKAIQYGGAAIGKSAAMPPNPDLTGKPQVVAALRDHIRGFGK